MEIENRAGVDAGTLRRLEALVAGQRTLEDVVRWGLSQEPPLLVADVVVQDEYTQDVVLPLPTSGFLVYDTT